MNNLNPQEWLLKADRDLALVEVALQHKPELTDLMCYHCQQAAEKYLKGVMTHLGIEVRKTHDLTFLLGKISILLPEIDAEFFRKALAINEYSMETRYAVPTVDPSAADVLTALEAATFFQKFAKAKIGSPGPPQP